MITWIKNFFSKLVLHERSTHKLALSFCVGNYIAFSPFIGFHGIMAFVFSWIFRLNLAVTFATTYFVNNPWTAVPVYMADYIFGYWLVHSVLKLNLDQYTPHWMLSISLFLEQNLGLPHLCCWSFLIGGNILGIIVSVALYPPIKSLFTQLIDKNNEDFSAK